MIILSAQRDIHITVGKFKPVSVKTFEIVSIIRQTWLKINVYLFGRINIIWTYTYWAQDPYNLLQKLRCVAGTRLGAT